MNNQHQHQVSRMDALSRALIGFDQMFDQMERRYSNSVSNNYPPHNILRTGENLYEIQIAVTGFEKDEIAVTVESNVLTVKGEGAESIRHEQPEIVYLHRGLATRDFVREFPLAEHIEVAGAEIRNGMLVVKLVRNIPESAKPKVIDIVDIK
jgi:molecular chaperone IbpA